MARVDAPLARYRMQEATGGRTVVNAMLRWLDFKGGGLSQGDVVTNTLCFADDSTLMTTMYTI